MHVPIQRTIDRIPGGMKIVALFMAAAKTAR
jgi:hypothetical protein